MRVLNKNGRQYRLPGILNQFQEEMYIHLIDWKWANITTEPGYYKKLPYDAILPESIKGNFPVIYPDVINALKKHHNKFYFKLHKHFNHMASSQAANANLFLPVLLHPRANDVLRLIKPDDFQELATEELDHGFQIEFWGASAGRGILSDHNSRAGTDADIAIAYNNKNRESCLWLIEHKLTEKEFTECGGFKSNNKQPYQNCNCDSNFGDILINPDLCYYHGKCNYRYWEITRGNDVFFSNHTRFSSCPFREGMNQLWRNQLLALAVEQDEKYPFQHVYFSVVKHPRNSNLDKTIAEYKTLTANNPKFSAFTSADVIKAAESLDDAKLNKWATWYRELYDL